MLENPHHRKAAFVEVAVARWDLFRLLSEKVRFRILALADAEELTIGELPEILGIVSPTCRATSRP